MSTIFSDYIYHKRSQVKTQSRTTPISAKIVKETCSKINKSILCFNSDSLKVFSE